MDLRLSRMMEWLRLPVDFIFIIEGAVPMVMATVDVPNAPWRLAVLLRFPPGPPPENPVLVASIVRITGMMIIWHDQHEKQRPG
jgi:hypothetical protein